jgi:hypothetical protein
MDGAVSDRGLGQDRETRRAGKAERRREVIAPGSVSEARGLIAARSGQAGRQINRDKFPVIAQKFPVPREKDPCYREKDPC